MGISISIAQPVLFHYDFDDCTFEESGIKFPGITPGGDPECICGMGAQSMNLDGVNDYLTISEQANIYLDSNFTYDFYFKMNEQAGETDIFSLRNNCTSLDSLMSLRYFSSSNELVFEIGSNINNYYTVREKLDKGNCWHRFTLVKFELEYFIYLDNRLLRKFVSRENIRLTKIGKMNFGNSPCNTTNMARRFNGEIDEIRLYRRALSELEIIGNFRYPDRIITPNTTIFQGESITINTGTSCALNYIWTPANSLDNENAASPIATPEESTTYIVKFNNANCVSTDSVRIFVADKDKLDCTALLLPKAFTPNNDGLNDQYGISNTFIVESLDYFEIYDRWGAKIWDTKILNEKWDGTNQGVPLNGGMYLYKIKYNCNSEERVKVDNFMMIR